MNLPDLALRRPISMLMVYAALFVLGGIAVAKMPLEFLPNLAGPNFWIEVPYRNATPAEVEKNVAIPAEELLRTVPDLLQTKTISRSSSCTILLEFDAGADMDYAYLEVRDRMDRLEEDLPRESREYFIWRFSSTDMQILYLSFYWDRSQAELYEILKDRIEPKLQRVDGVGSVSVWGFQRRQVFIDVDQDLLKAHGISLYDLALRLERSHFILGAGEIVDGGNRLLVRTLSEYGGLEEIENFPVNRRGLRLRDIAVVQYRYPDQTSIARINGRPAISLGIKKESEANTVEVCRAVHKELDRILSSPSFSGIQYSVFFDQSKYILDTFHDLRDAGLWGGLFAVLVLYFFLRRIPATLLVSLSIPVSVVVAVSAMYFLGMTLNIISMVGLMLGIGMLVDNSIVVSENIFRLREAGTSAMEASREGSREVSMAILASTLTTIVVFLPMVFMETGAMKVYMREIGIAISLSLFASLFVALTFIPLVAARLPGEKAKGGGGRQLNGLMKGYRHALAWSLGHKGDVVCMTILLILLTVLVPLRRVAQKGEVVEGVPRMIVDVRILGAQEPGRTEGVLGEVERVLLAKRDELNIESIYVHAGFRAERNTLHVFFREDRQGGASAADAKRRLLEALPSLPDVEYTVPESGRTEGEGRNEIAIRFSGNDPAILERIAGEAVKLLTGTQGVIRAETDIDPGTDEIQVSVDRALAKRHGINPMVAAQTIAFGIRGYPMKKMKLDGKEVDVLLQLEEADRRDITKLKDLQLLSEEGGLVPLSVAARFRETPGERAINRSEGRRTVQVRVQTSDEALSVLKDRLLEVLRPMDLPAGYQMDLGESVQDLERTSQSFVSAIVFSLLLIYVLLGVLFESYVHPFTILVSVPLALIGSYWAMYLTGAAMDVVAYIGLILMVGIVVNNAIVIVDRMNQLRLAGKGREEAVLQAGQDRIRPVLMTAATTVLGLLPLAFGGGTGMGGLVMFAPLGKAVLGGLAISTLLTLFVVPVFYLYMEQAGSALKRLLSVAMGGR